MYCTCFGSNLKVFCLKYHSKEKETILEVEQIKILQ